MHILIDLDGTLRDVRQDTPISHGIQVCGALSAYNQITILTELSKSAAEQWLNQNKVVDFDNILDSSYELEGVPLKQRQLTSARSKGKIDIVFTADPSLWAFAFELGITVILFGDPDYVPPSYRPDAPQSVRRWNDIEESIRKQNERRTKEARIVRTETVRFE